MESIEHCFAFGLLGIDMRTLLLSLISNISRWTITVLAIPYNGSLFGIYYTYSTFIIDLSIHIILIWP